MPSGNDLYCTVKQGFKKFLDTYRFLSQCLLNIKISQKFTNDSVV